MPPKAQSVGHHGRGRPKRSAAPEPPTSPTRIPVTDTIPKKRGRPANKTILQAQAAVGTPKKRGRPAKVKAEESIVEEAPAPKKRMGRPAKKEAAKEPIAATKKRAGRPSKIGAAVAEALATPKRRGRPARNAITVDLSRVAGSPRVTKSHSKPAAKGPKKAALATRMKPMMRSKLRTRLPPAQKITEGPAPQPAKRRGRPMKAAVVSSSPKKEPARKTKNAAVSKPTAPRKKRGITTFDVPDKFAAQVQQYIQELQDAESLPTPDADDSEEIDAEAGAAEQDMEIEDENIRITSATTDGEADADEDGAITISKEIQEEVYEENANADADAGAEIGHNVQEDDIQDEVVETVIIHEEIQDGEATEPNTPSPEPEVEVEMTIQEVVQIEQEVEGEDSGLLQRDDGDENETEAHNPTSIFDDQSDLDGYAQVTEPRPTAGVIFG